MGAWLIVLTLAAAQAPELIDRTLAIVSGRTITLSDARTVQRLGLVEGATIDADVVQRLVDRQLMLIEAERYQPPDPAAGRVEAALASITSGAGGEAALARILAAGGFSLERLRAWVRDDLRIEGYLQQRFAADDRRQDLIADWVSELRRRAEVTILAP
jgi:hypothetical protein